MMKAIGKRMRMSNTRWQYIILNSYRISIKYIKIYHYIFDKIIKKFRNILQNPRGSRGIKTECRQLYDKRNNTALCQTKRWSAGQFNASSRMIWTNHNSFEHTSIIWFILQNFEKITSVPRWGGSPRVQRCKNPYKIVYFEGLFLQQGHGTTLPRNDHTINIIIQRCA